MKRLLITLGFVAFLSACQTQAPIVEQKETYPYGMTEKEWNELSIKDKAKIRRDFYFYEKGSTHFVNPGMEVEGKKDDSQTNVFLKKSQVQY